MTTSISSVSFAGCGALNFYQVGVAQALLDGRDLRQTAFLGASAGAGLAVLLCDGHDPFAIVRRMLRLTREVVGSRRLLGPSGAQRVGAAFTDEFLDDETHARVSGRVHLSITRLAPFGNWRVSAFQSRADLADALRAACFVPGPLRPAMRFRGAWCLDGGMTDNEPVLGPETFRVSPLWTSLRANVRPSPLRVGLNEAIRLPGPDRAWALFDQGVRDGRLRLRQGSLVPTLGAPSRTQ